MIKNDRQLSITTEQAKEFKQALDTLESQLAAAPDDILLEIQRNAVKSEYEVLSEQILYYNGLKDGTIQAIKCATLDDLPKALIEMRIAFGLTQKELAEMVGIHEQQIQRYEATDYEGISRSKMTDIAEKLNMMTLNTSWGHPHQMFNSLLPSGVTPENVEQMKQIGLWNL